MREARINSSLKSKVPIRGLISLPCQKLYILLLVDAYIFRLITGAFPALIYNPKAKIVPTIHPLTDNCTILFRMYSLTGIFMYTHKPNPIIATIALKKPEKLKKTLK